MSIKILKIKSGYGPKRQSLRGFDIAAGTVEPETLGEVTWGIGCAQRLLRAEEADPPLLKNLRALQEELRGREDEYFGDAPRDKYYVDMFNNWLKESKMIEIREVGRGHGSALLVKECDRVLLVARCDAPRGSNGACYQRAYHAPDGLALGHAKNLLHRYGVSRTCTEGDYLVYPFHVVEFA